MDWINQGRISYDLAAGEEPECSQIVAIGMLVDCVDDSSSLWFDDKWGFVLSGVIPIEPISWTGARSLWDCKFKYRPLSKLD